MRHVFPLLLLLAGCAHETEVHESTVAAATPPSGDVIAVDQQEVTPEPQARPRLTHTITLGRENSDPTYETPPPAPRDGHAGGPNVVINNNVVVQQPPTYYYGGFGGYGGYGYGGYGGGYGYRSSGYGNRGAAWSGGGNSDGPRHYGSGGGAATPPVGGNWPAAPSYGPRSMR